MQELTPELAQSFGIEALRGALIAEGVKDSPAEHAGMKKGEVVMAYRGKAVPEARTLRNEVATTPIGHQVQVTVLRRGQQQELTATVQSGDAATKTLAAVVRERLGVDGRPITAQEATRYHLDLHQGATITRVAPGSALGRAGFEVQDILLAIDEQPIARVDTLIELVAALQPQQRVTVLALDHRRGETGSIQVAVR